MTQVSTDVLVVGGGMAGVFAAVKAHDAGAKVMLVDKGTVGKSGQTPFARGIFRFDEEQTGMSKAEYLERTAEASEFMNNPAYTELLLDHSAERIDELDSWGFFDSAAYAKSLRRPLEERKIPLYERVMLTHLLKEDGRIAGAMGLFIDEKKTLVILAKSVILCTGASGFKPPGWQIGSLTSDGDAMAYRIGAEITGKEWCDGHSRTNPGLEGLNQVVSFANLTPMLGVEQNVEVSQNGPISSMGPPPGDGPDGAPDGRGPMGPPPGGGPPGGGPPEGRLPAAETRRSTWAAPRPGCPSTRPRACSRPTENAPRTSPDSTPPATPSGRCRPEESTPRSGRPWPARRCRAPLPERRPHEYAETTSHAGLSQKTVTRSTARSMLLCCESADSRPHGSPRHLQGIMIPNFILYVKSEQRLSAALTYVEYLRDHHVPLLIADDEHELRQAHETANMVLNAEMKLRASLMRTESRGSHYREDHPERNDDEWTAWIKILPRRRRQHAAGQTPHRTQLKRTETHGRGQPSLRCSHGCHVHIPTFASPRRLGAIEASVHQSAAVAISRCQQKSESGKRAGSSTRVSAPISTNANPRRQSAR